MGERKDCKHFYYRNKQMRSIDSYTAKGTIQMPICRIRKMTVGGCRDDCKWFEPKQ